MSLFYNNPYEFSRTVVSCPYNKNHRIARDRLPKHISKCEKNYPVDHRVMCPYDATHRVSKAGLTKHVDTCCMRALIEPELYQLERNGSTEYEITMLDVAEEDQYENNVNETRTEDAEKNEDNGGDGGAMQDVSLCKLQAAENDSNELRPPRGYSKAMMINTDDSIVTNDTDSVVSFMTIGRGACIEKNRKRLIQLNERSRKKQLHLDSCALH